MFHRLGRLILHCWLWLIIAWGALFAALWFTAPAWNSVADEGEFSFLPEDAPTRRGERLFEQAFPDRRAESSIVLVVHRQDDESLTDTDKEFVRSQFKPQLEELSQKLAASAEKASPQLEATGEGAGQAGETTEVTNDASGGRETEQATQQSPILRIRTFDDQPAGPLLISSNGAATLVVIELTTEFLVDRNQQIVGRVEEVIRSLRQSGDVPEGLAMDVTGSAVVGRDIQQARQESAEAIRSWTIWLVIGLLLVVYRAPLVALVPLASLYVAVEVSLNLLALLAEAGYIAVFQGLEVYTTVLVYGAGVDYSLFLISRHREELSRSDTPHVALVTAIAGVGTAIAASAGTEMFGIGMLSFAQFGKFQQAGISIALGLFIVLCTSLTLAPALLRLLGRRAFWPKPAAQSPNDEKAGLSERLWNRVGARLRKHPVVAGGLAMALMVPFAIVALRQYNHLSYGLVADLPQGAVSVDNLEVLERYFATGTTGPATVLIQAEDADFTQPEGIEQIETLVSRLKLDQEKLKIADLRSVADPLGITSRVEEELPTDPGPLIQEVIRQRAVDHYVSQVEPWTGDVTRLDIVLSDDPFSRESIEHLDRLQTTVIESLPDSLQDATVYFTGPTASLRDLKNVAQEDRTRIQLLVTGVVLIVLMLVLRRIAIPLFLIVTVLFSFLVTLGATHSLFWMLSSEPFPGLHWTVPIFLFTVLIAVGEDYNIYLVTRVDEEQGHHGSLDGISTALAKTGGIISGCGIIMAGTFSALAVGGALPSMRQLGVALAFGVLLDTFVIRPVLVPCYLIVINSNRLGRWGRILGARRSPTRT